MHGWPRGAQDASQTRADRTRRVAAWAWAQAVLAATARVREAVMAELPEERVKGEG
jgi:hypothetical protein